MRLARPYRSPGRIARPPPDIAMLSRLLVGLSLMALSVAIHASGLASALPWLRRGAAPDRRIWSGTWRIIAVAGWMILVHLCEIALWALFYVESGAIADAQSAMYFSAVT